MSDDAIDNLAKVVAETLNGFLSHPDTAGGQFLTSDLTDEEIGVLADRIVAQMEGGENGPDAVSPELPLDSIEF